jgi:hypothetical protein
MASLATLAWLSTGAFAANQTPDLSPITIGSSLPFTTTVDNPVSFPGQTLPTLHSFAKASVSIGGHNQWLLIGGMTNGIHDLGGGGFDPASHNKSIHVIDPVTQQIWSRSIIGSGLTQDQINSLSTTNAQSTQVGNRLYISGGYGNYIDNVGDLYYTTFDRLTAIDLPGMMEWVKTGSGMASAHLRQISDPILRVTGGDMHTTSNGRTHLVFGQDYPDAYEPRLTGIYTRQVRSFTIVDDGTNLSISDAIEHPTNQDFRRRDLNVVPIIDKVGDQYVEKMQALSGVFTSSFGAWTVPVTIDDQGNATQPDPTNPSTFKQGMNGYRCATLGLYSAERDEMHTLLLGGISYQFFNEQLGQFEEDFNLPFVNDCTDIVIDADGNMTQHLLPDLLPEILSPTTGEPYLLGAETRFFLADGIETYGNGVIDLDALTGRTLVGYLYGGIAAVQPNGGPTVGSNALLPVWISPTVPEPASGLLAVVAACVVRSRSLRGEACLAR